jgi:hypothetical protein
VSLLGNTDATDTITPAVVPYAVLLFPVQTGTVSSIRGTNLSLGNDASGKPVTLDVTQTIQNTGIEAVSVPAGNFANAMKQVTTVKATARSSTQSVTVSGTDNSWMVPGVGVVKDASTVSANSLAINESKELRGYVLNGLRHGIGAQHDAETSVSPNVSLPPPRSPGALGYNGSGFALVYQRVMGGGPTYQNTWYAHVLNRDGTSGAVSSLTYADPYSNTSGSPAIASDGSSYLIALQHFGVQKQSVIGVVQWVPGMTPAATLTIVTPGDAYWPALAFDGAQYLLVYGVTSAPMTGQLWGQFISAQTGQASGAAIALTPFGSGRYLPAVAFDGQNYLVVWFDSAGPAGGPSTPGYYGRRVTPAGLVLDAQPILIAQQNSAGSTYGPAVAFDGTNYLVAYPDNRVSMQGELTTISATRVSTAGALLDGSATVPGIVIGTAMNTINDQFALAFIGGDYWLSWRSSLDVGTITEDGLYMVRISTAGAVVSPAGKGFRLAPGAQDSTPALAGGSGGGMAAWTAQVPNSGDSIRCATVDAAGP